MYLAILLSVISSHGVKATIHDGIVTVDNRPGCIVEALYGDATRPVIFCRNVVSK